MGRNNKAAPPPPPPPDYKAAATPSPVQSELETEALKTIRWAGKGDFRSPREGGIFVNYADPAMLNRHSELISNTAGQGIEGLGVADPNHLATVRENRKAHQAENAAGQYESDIKEGVGAARGVGLNMAGLDAETRQAILSSQTGLYNTRLAKPEQPKWWQQLIMGAAPAAIAAI